MEPETSDQIQMIVSQLWIEPHRIRQLMTMPYEEYLRSPEWKVRRDIVLARDRYRCRLCNTTESLQIHHRTYERRGNEDLNDLTTLCQPCHEHFHERMQQDLLMEQTKAYAPPTEEERKKDWEKSVQQWEVYFLGQLLSHPTWYQETAIYNLLVPNDFTRKEHQEIYQLFASASSSQPFEQWIPDTLLPVAKQAVTYVDSRWAGFSEKPTLAEVIQSGVRLKTEKLQRASDDLATLIRQAVEAKDKDLQRKLSLQVMENRRLSQKIHKLRNSTRIPDLKPEETNGAEKKEEETTND